jgi:hypothetical protein
MKLIRTPFLILQNGMNETAVHVGRGEWQIEDGFQFPFKLFLLTFWRKKERKKERKE